MVGFFFEANYLQAQSSGIEDNNQRSFEGFTSTRITSVCERFLGRDSICLTACGI